ncbi:hypothetical protein CHS0354_009457 [Potamilus streckersoni]|uniref:2-oxoglutarate and iron-dependent oxygenase JMJD4 n=1 Tax=Potamilus streckersoni TaxID=2493646 RepID=A0AAE0WDE0_9BIVA|nr:hypothetical protein CHS0354_009457 [Potamilus streckersoni]
MFAKPECKLDKSLQNTTKLEQIRNSSYSTSELVRIDYEISYAEFFKRYLLENRPCILSSRFTESWKSRKEWVDETGCPNLLFLDNMFGGASVPVADCGKEEYSSHPKISMTLTSYIEYLRNKRGVVQNNDERCLYLKDWHFTRAFPDYMAYDTPLYFRSDWMNEFWDSQNSIDDDYRFIYIGPKGSWTPFHADVFHSFSWSANICGRKKWILFPPGEEAFLRNRFGNLAYDVTSSGLKDQAQFPNYSKLTRQIEIIQEPGEIIFVPSGWHHQVFNMEDTISINHNWLNGCNVDMCWEHVKQSLASVKKEIEDCIGMDEWEERCQLILKASAGIDYKDFFKFMNFIAVNRFAMLDRMSLVSKDEAFPNSKAETASQNATNCDTSRLPDICSQCRSTCKTSWSLSTADKKNVTFSSNQSYNKNHQQLGEKTDSCLSAHVFSRCIVDEQNECLFNKEHLLFDLFKVKCILQDMKDNPDFQGIKFDEYPYSLDRLISKIESLRCDHEEK